MGEFATAKLQRERVLMPNQPALAGCISFAGFTVLRRSEPRWNNDSDRSNSEGFAHSFGQLIWVHEPAVETAIGYYKSTTTRDGLRSRDGALRMSGPWSV